MFVFLHPLLVVGRQQSSQEKTKRNGGRNKGKRHEMEPVVLGCSWPMEYIINGALTPIIYPRVWTLVCPVKGEAGETNLCLVSCCFFCVVRLG